MKRNVAKALVLMMIVSASELALAAASRLSTSGDQAAAARTLVNRDKDGLALSGYDPVAYFDGGKPVMGDPQYRTRHEGATYQFATQAHQQAFEADPGRYTPSYGGYCGYAASINKVSPVNPELFQVIDGRLILQHNKKAWDLWNEDVPGNIRRADANWPGLVDSNGVAAQSRSLINLDAQGLALQGYDPVAYFTESRAVRGQAEFEALFDGGTYRFASRENKERFERAPLKYAPAYGGFCAYAASIKKVSPINPEIFQIENGRLLLQHTQKAYDLFNADTQGNIVRADKNWPGLVARRGM